MSGATGALERVGVVGCGLMGSGIAEVAARAGLDVAVVEAGDDAVRAGRARVERSLAQAVRRGKLTEGERDATLERIRITGEPEVLGDRQLVVEAVPEVEELKLETFRTIDAVVEDPAAVLASNTSSIPIMKLAMATRRPEHVIGIHFFNPVPVLPLVELVPSLLTSPGVVDEASGFASGTLGKHVIRSQDRAGFVVNALLIPVPAVVHPDAGVRFATAEGHRLGHGGGLRPPHGALALSDLIGLDTVMAVAQSMYEEFKEPLYAPPPMLLRMVDAGLLGRKSGRGFHRYG